MVVRKAGDLGGAGVEEIQVGPPAGVKRANLLHVQHPERLARRQDALLDGVVGERQ